MKSRAQLALLAFGGLFVAAGSASPAHGDPRARIPTLAVAATPTAEGGGGVAVFRVRLSRASRSRVSVRFATANGSATAGADYGARKGRLVFAPGQISKPVAVRIIDDADPEPQETFFLRLSRARSARIAVPRATAAIVASDLPSPFTLRAELTGAEQLPGPGSASGRGTATVTLDATREVASFTVTISGVERPTEAGIGRGRRGDPPTASVLRFTDQFPPSGTLSDSKRLELIAILELYREPDRFFVEVRSATGVGSGGIRGQLAPVP